MQTTLYDKNGEAEAYVTDDYHNTIYLWDGSPVAYLYDDEHVYGINGRHLGWFTGDILFTNNGERIGFTAGACPVSIAKEPKKVEKMIRSEIQARWKAPPFPKLGFNLAEQDLAELLREGEAILSPKKELSEESQGDIQ
jgi:hypothetical protein